MPLSNKDVLLSKLTALTDPHELFREIIQLGRKAKEYPEEFRKKEYLIKGCFSQIWLHSYIEKGLVYYDFDSDAEIPKGITAVLVEILSGCSPEQILSFDSSFLQEVGIDQHLSNNRRNGLANLMQQFKNDAELNS